MNNNEPYTSGMNLAEEFNVCDTVRKYKLNNRLVTNSWNMNELFRM